MAQKILQEEDCQNVLKKYLKTKDFDLKTYEILNFHNPLQGLVGEHFTLKIEFTHENKTQSENFFVKTLSNNPLMLKFTKELQVYEKEEFFYGLLEEFEILGIDTSFAPRGLFFKPFVTVLEDISGEFKGTPKRKLLDLVHCRSCLECIAKFHASSIIYEKKNESEGKPSLRQNQSQLLEDKLALGNDTLATKWMSSAIGAVIQLIDLVLEQYKTNDEFKSKLLELLSSETTFEGLLSGIIHADLWSTNFLYAYSDGKPVQTKLLDFQLIKYGPLELDVAEFLMTNTTHSFRKQHFNAMVEHYYENLAEALTSSGLSSEMLPSCGDFLSSCNNFKLAGKIHAVVDHSYTFMADEIYRDVMKSEESLKKFIFEDRNKYVVESYNTNEEFRKMLDEDIVELRDLIFS